MVQRGCEEPLGDQIVERQEPASARRRSSDDRRRRRFGLRNGQRAYRNQRTVLAVPAFLTVRTARHVVRHCGHIGRVDGSQLLRRRWRGERQSNQPCDDEYREQTTDESTNVHTTMIPRPPQLWKAFLDHVFANQVKPQGGREPMVNFQEVIRRPASRRIA